MPGQTRIDVSDIQSGIRALTTGAARRRQDAFREIKPLAKADLRQRGKDRSDGAGTRWPAASPASRRAARRDRRRNRRPGNLGKLPRAWKSQVTSEQLRFVNAVEWASVHDQGGTVGRGAKIPARPFGAFSPEFSDRAVEIYADTVLGGW